MRLLLTISLLLLLSACQSSQKASREQMLAAIQARGQLPDSHYDLLWYQGTRGGWHHFKHIRGYFLDEQIFVVDAQQWPIARPLPYSRDSRQWQRVERIGDRWHSARKYGEQGWQADACGEERVCLNLD